MLRVAVKLPAARGRIGDYVADVTALEAAGADSIWIDISGVTTAEPWMLLGAIAAVTHRVRLGLMIDAESSWPDAVDILGRLTGGRVVVGVPPGREIQGLLDQLKSPGSSPPSVLVSCDTQGEVERSARLGEGVIFPGGDDEVRELRAKSSHDGEFEIWIDAQIPTDKAGWANMVASLEAAGATGIMIHWEPRVIDLLRNAGEPDDRTDLLIATG